MHAEGSRLLDQEGREVRLNGINARVAPLFDVTFDDGRVAVEELTAFNDDDEAVLDALGMNAQRLLVNWSCLEPDPRPTALSAPCLAALDERLDRCAARGHWCIVDLHQDAYSKEIGEDGAPLWAIVPPPSPDELREGPLDDLEARRLSTIVGDAFTAFFNNATLPPDLGDGGVQDAYLAMLQRLATHLRDKPFVAGIEVMNEPFGDDLPILGFAERATAAVHDVDADRLVLWEPNSLRNLQDSARTDGGLHLDNDAYAPHLYPEIFSGQRDEWDSGDPARLVLSTTNAQQEALEHDAPLIVTEYGNAPYAQNGLAWIARMQQEMDAVNASRFFWVYEEVSQENWGLYEREGRVLREDLASTRSWPYAAAVSGTVQSHAFVDGELRVAFTGGGTHTLMLPTRAFPSGVAVRSDDVDVEVDAGRLPRVDIECGIDNDGAHVLTARAR